MLGLLFIPLIGSASDQCNSSYGRRRPFIWLLSVGILLALFIIPHADFLATHLFWGGRTLEVKDTFDFFKVQKADEMKWSPTSDVTVFFFHPTDRHPHLWGDPAGFLWTSLLHTTGGTVV